MIDEVRRHVGGRLVGAGWSRADERPDSFQLQQQETIVYQIGLGSPETCSDGSMFLPAVAVRWPEVARLEGPFLALPPDVAKYVATIGRSVVDLHCEQGGEVDERWSVLPGVGGETLGSRI
ncbi:hypothetical protein [Actinomadura rayongensis]|uniref:Uncharacterized protein n=1 Tax=Actinomadura rayongensis TaxID=1429076 RepID=A0A6I4WA24_9ACTN|nr:hypothetical protein [Actinomadura rayongensis]MXQ66478.1 hypothetical protein [Actinomadura rayongensis]